jgi:glycosyltransferase involved in cell wall biosynthesis
MKMIFHTPYPIIENGISGSQVRPLKMLKAFQQIGYEVHIVSGFGQERLASLKELKNKLLTGEKFDFLYSETSTMPMFLTEKSHIPKYIHVELALLKNCKRFGIPTGVYYRDIHWKFKHFQKGTSKFKQFIAILFYKLELIFIKRYFTRVFLPSILMAQHLPKSFEKKLVSQLPPGIELLPESYTPCNQKLRLIYVGGLTSPLYNLKDLMTCVYENQETELVLVCRRNEFEQAQNTLKIGKNVEVVHKAKNELEEEYNKCDIAMLTYGDDPYLRFGMPAKLFEAIEYSKPVIISSSLESAADLVKTHGLGFVVNNEQDLSKILKRLVIHRKELATIKANIQRYKSTITWIERAKEVQKLLVN